MMQENKATIKQYTKEAIALAMQSRWEEAAAVNRAILELSPEDIDAYNRLGRALLELGEYDKAKEAYGHSLELNPYNSIARKNFYRLSYLTQRSPPPRNPQKVVADIFIEETGKAGVVNLTHLAPKEVIARMAPGEEVTLQAEGQRLLVRDLHGEYLGEVEPKYGLRLTKLISGGNRYVAAISSLREKGVKVTIQEVYQHPSQAGRLSFLPREEGGFRPYVRESLVRSRLEEEEAGDEADDTADREGFTIADFYEIVEQEEAG